MTKNDRKFLVQKIRSEYTEKEHSELDALKALDRKVKRPVNRLAYTIGSLGAIIMGTGMSLVMTDLGSHVGLSDAMLPGILVGVAGLFVACINYPAYRRRLNKRRKRYADEIIALSDKLMEE